MGKTCSVICPSTYLSDIWIAFFAQFTTLAKLCLTGDQAGDRVLRVINE